MKRVGNDSPAEIFKITFLFYDFKLTLNVICVVVFVLESTLSL